MSHPSFARFLSSSPNPTPAMQSPFDDDPFMQAADPGLNATPAMSSSSETAFQTSPSTHLESTPYSQSSMPTTSRGPIQTDQKTHPESLPYSHASVTMSSRAPIQQMLHPHVESARYPSAHTKPTPQLQSTPASATPLTPIHASPFTGGQVASMQQPQNSVSQKHRNASLSQARYTVAVQCFNRQLQDYAAHHRISMRQIPAHIINELKRRAEIMAHRMVSRQRNAQSNGTPQRHPTPQHEQHQQPGAQKRLAASPLPEHTPPVVGHSIPGRSSQTPAVTSPIVELVRRMPPDSQHHRQLPTHGETQASSSREDDRPKTWSEQESIGRPAQVTNQAPHNLRVLKNQVDAAIRTVNNSYATREQSYQQFLNHYPFLQLGVVEAMYNWLSHVTCLDQLAQCVFQVDDASLLRIVQLVSAKLRSNLAPLRQWTAQSLQAIIDPQFKWTALSRTFTMFYDSFSSLKAALKQRDKRHQDGQRSFIDALGYDRSQILDFLKPGSDEELEADLSAESAEWNKRKAQRGQQLDRTQELHRDQLVQQEWEVLRTAQHPAGERAKESNGARDNEQAQQVPPDQGEQQVQKKQQSGETEHVQGEQREWRAEQVWNAVHAKEASDAQWNQGA